jgi:eukaryotic-like serine/threonine-protein kinase
MNDVAERLQEVVGEAYVIRRQLGQGGMAIVFLAHDTKHDRDVAIKVLRPELSASLGAERFLREIQIAAKLSHPHILPLYDSGGDGELLYYVMPCVEGESLRERLEREGPLPVEEAVGLARQVAGALAHAHAQGVVHRDIKPENVLLSGGEAVVTDFGIARAVAAAGTARLTETGIAVGTPAYMSPEQASGGEEVDGRSDIYSLGCVLYEMLAGHAPFLGRTAAEVLARHSADPVPSVTAARRTVPIHVEKTIEHALAKAPVDRQATATEFAEELQSSPAADAGGFWRRPIALVAVLMVVAVAGAALWLVLRRRRAAANGVAPNTVAVLYCESQSPDTTDVYLADGVTEEITQRLGDIPRLTVKSRYAVRPYRGVRTDPTTLGRKLGVANLVSCSLQHVGNRLRVSAELVRAATGDRIWGDEYDRTDTALLDVETQVASAIARAISGRLDASERATLAKRPTASPAAYDHFLRGNYFLAQRTASATALALAQYEAALRIDSTFARAWARDAVGYALFLAWEWPSSLSTDSLLARGVHAVKMALAVDSTSSDAWMASGMFDWFVHPTTWTGAVQAQRRAVALDSTNAEAQNMLGISLFYLGRDSAAAVAFRHALALDPLRPISLLRLGEMAWFDGRSREASVYIDSALAVSPAFVLGYLGRAELREDRGDAQGAKADVETVFRIAPQERSAPDPMAYGILAAADAETGDTAAARLVVDTLHARLGSFDGLTPNSAVYTSLAELAAGERDGALQTLEQGQPNVRLWWDLRWPDFDPLRSDPAFRQVLSRNRQVPN